MKDRRRQERPPADLESALDDLGIEWKASGSGEALARCPHPQHDDSTPSWSVNLETGLHGCFSCGYVGNWQQLVRDVLGLSHDDAVAWTRKRQTVGTRQRISKDDSAIGAGRRERETPVVDESELWRFVDPPAWAIRERRLTLAACQEYGVLWDAEEELWITPIRDPETNALWGWQEKAEDGRHFRNYPRGVHKSRTLFGLQLASQSTQTILVESPLDAVRIYAAGFRGAVSSFGVRVSDTQRALLVLRAGVGGGVLLALDNDSKGLDQTAHLLTQLLRARAFNYQRLSTKDPGEMTDEQIAIGIRESIGAIRYLRQAHHAAK